MKSKILKSLVKSAIITVVAVVMTFIVLVAIDRLTGEHVEWLHRLILPIVAAPFVINLIYRRITAQDSPKIAAQHWNFQHGTDTILVTADEKGGKLFINGKIHDKVNGDFQRKLELYAELPGGDKIIAVVEFVTVVLSADDPLKGTPLAADGKREFLQCQVLVNRQPLQCVEDLEMAQVFSEFFRGTQEK